MKKGFILLIGIAVFSFTITSCKKDYTCTCNVYVGSQSKLKLKTLQHVYHASKGSAKDLCQQSEDKMNQESTGVYYECSIQ